MMNILSTGTPAMLRHRTTTPFFAITLLLLTASLRVTGQTIAFASQQQHPNYVVGEEARLECYVASGFNIESSFTWTKDSIDIIENDRISVTVDSVRSGLIIRNLQASDAGEYTCSKEGFPSIAVRITVTNPDTPFFRDVEEVQVFAENTDAVVKCPTYLGNPPTASMRWVDSSRRLIRNDTKFTPDNERLTIHNIRLEESGTTYQCDIIRSSPFFFESKIIRVEVRPQSEYVPKIVDLRRRVTVSYDQPLDLPCQLEEPRDNVQYSWTIHTDFEHDHLVNSNNTLRRDRGQFLGGIYTCRAENEFGYDIADFAVKITAPPMPNTCAMVRKTTNVGTTIVLKHCDLTTPVPLSELTFQWSKDSVDIVSGGQFTINHRGWLTIENVQESNFGTYRVNISNGEGSAVHTVNLERVELVTTPTSDGQRLRDDDTVTVNLNFHIQSGSTTCSDIKERNQQFFQEQLLQQFNSFSDIINLRFENPTIDCSSTSDFQGIYKTTIKGSNARRLDSQIGAKGISPFTLSNGQTVTIKICANECSLGDTTAQQTKPWINKTSGIVIAVTVIAVMLAGVILLMVILIRYRRRSFHKNIDEEQILPLHKVPRTNLDKNFKPPYYRSISVNLPITSR